ncbi:Na+/H+ antiporter [Pedobacter sp. HMF7647]|uniref:Na+/H+ antiporter n=1 Tax=Hufsiella arboris TaxID=2695275 RepID=A0A7K1YAW4_9SPHI|nr:Na+/H+ antiporter [Hufsiella arboris]MXV51570.1 Na+/H+ antiporter [Hufsiella arboris]
MIHENLLLIIALLFAVSLLSVIGEKLRISYPIFLVIAGLGISFIPNVPQVKLDPDMVFLVFLPVLLCSAAWNTSWTDFVRFRRPINMLAFGLVITTATAVAFVSSSMIPGFTLALGFVLGGIVSPPDAVAATSVMEHIKLPKHIVVILEGESLVNDASSLIILRVAMAAVITGNFVFWKAGADFIVVTLGGVVIGLAIALIIYGLFRFLPTTSSIDTAITLVAPYLMYLIAEELHVSGVLSVVSGGLFLSAKSHEVFSYNSRLQARSVWATIVYLFNGLVFILIGLQLHQIVEGLGQYNLKEAIFYGLIISLTAIIVRIAWVFTSAYVLRLLGRYFTFTGLKPSWRQLFIVSWSGMRGVVSLAAALAIPFALGSGERFPHRNLILFITFTVILITLVVQGISLPFIVRFLKIEPEENKDEELKLQMAIAAAVVSFVDENYADHLSANDSIRHTRNHYQNIVDIEQKRLEKDENDTVSTRVTIHRKFVADVLQVKREELEHFRKQNAFSSALLNKLERQLDLEEARLKR